MVLTSRKALAKVTGQMEVHLSTLNAETKISHVKAHLASRKGSPEHRRLDPREFDLCWREYDRLTRELEESPLSPPRGRQIGSEGGGLHRDGTHESD